MKKTWKLNANDKLALEAVPISMVRGLVEFGLPSGIPESYAEKAVGKLRERIPGWRKKSLSRTQTQTMREHYFHLAKLGAETLEAYETSTRSIYVDRQ